MSECWLSQIGVNADQLSPQSAICSHNRQEGCVGRYTGGLALSNNSSIFVAWKHIVLKRDSIVGTYENTALTSPCGQAMTTQPQLYPITFHSQWSFRLSSALQSLLHVLSGNEYKINFWLIRIMVVSQCVIFIWGGRNLSDPSVAKAFSGFVWKKLTCGHEIAATLSRACSLHWGVLFDQATYWGKKYLKDFSHLVVSIIISSCRL